MIPGGKSEDPSMLEGDVVEGNSWLCLALRDEWVEHAAWTCAGGLLLLLGSNVNCPPDGSWHLEVLVFDVFNDSIAMGAWVGFEIDSLDWILHYDIVEVHVSDACKVTAWWHGADGHSNGVKNMAVSHFDVFSACGDFVVDVGWLDSDGIVVVSDVDVLDEDVGS